MTMASIIFAILFGIALLVFVSVVIHADLLARSWANSVWETHEWSRADHVCLWMSTRLPRWHGTAAHRWAKSTYPSLWKDYDRSRRYSKPFPMAGNKYR